MSRLFIIGEILLILLISQLINAQQRTEPQSKLVEFHMALLKRGPKWTAAPPPTASATHNEHLAYVQSLFESGKAVIAGPLSDDGEVKGVYVLRAKSPEEARSLVEADPAVKSGHLVAEMHPWWSEEVMKKPSTPLKVSTAYLAFLTRGPKWSAEKTAASEEIQKAHLENMRKLAATKKLVVAGPFGDNGTLRGIFVFKVSSLEEAKTLAETDPAVKAGRLAVELHPWLVPEGVLP